MDKLEKLHQRVTKIEDWILIAEKRITDIEAQNIERDANIAALLTCLRTFGKIDQAELQKAFASYAKDYHQKYLERLEDEDPAMAARLDNRNPKIQ